MCEYHSIDEYHLCEECRHHIPVPSNWDMTKWECACTLKRSEVNGSGGLTRCPAWEDLGI